MMAVWSEISTSNLVGAIRLDAEFWQPKYLDKEKQIRFSKHTHLGALVTSFKKGIFYILAKEYEDQGVPFYQSSNVGAILPNEDNITFITDKKHSEEYKTALTTGDLMIVKTGKSGASVVFEESCNVSQDVIATKALRNRINPYICIRPVGIDPYFLSALLNTRFGQLQMKLHTRGTSGQLHFYPRDARKILIWPAPDSLQAEVRELMTKADRAAQESTQLLDQAKSCVEQLIEEAVRA